MNDQSCAAKSSSFDLSAIVSRPVNSPSGQSPSCTATGQTSGTQEAESTARQTGLTNMAVGAGLCILGIAITAGTYASASSGQGGGIYLIMWGPMLFGGWRFLKGLFQVITGSAS